MTNERKRFDRRTNIAEIMRKPDTALTAEDTKAIAARVIADEAPSGSTSRTGPSKGVKVEGDVQKAIPKTAPAVVRKIAKIASRAAAAAEKAHSSHRSSGQTLWHLRPIFLEVVTTLFSEAKL